MDEEYRGTHQPGLALLPLQNRVQPGVPCGCYSPVLQAQDNRLELFLQHLPILYRLLPAVEHHARNAVHDPVKGRRCLTLLFSNFIHELPPPRERCMHAPLLHPGEALPNLIGVQFLGPGLVKPLQEAARKCSRQKFHGAVSKTQTFLELAPPFTESLGSQLAPEGVE